MPKDSTFVSIIMMPIIVNPESDFRLLSLNVKRHPLLGEVNLVFANDEFEQHSVAESIYTTVIIGPNGVGKTYILKVVADIFNYLYKLKESSETPRSLGYFFDVSYWYNDNKFFST